MGANFGQDNHNWRGGRSLASNGYQLIRVGIGHPMADVRGYAYEHRIVAAEKVGRMLDHREHVHHVDGDKTNNRPENLEVLPAAWHRVEHRKLNKGRRLPNQPNVETSCACGCGATFPAFDDTGRPRRFVHGHNPNAEPVCAAVLGAVGEHRVTIATIRGATGLDGQSVRAAVSKLSKQGRLRRVAHGVYEIASTEVPHV